MNPLSWSLRRLHTYRQGYLSTTAADRQQGAPSRLGPNSIDQRVADETRQGSLISLRADENLYIHKYVRARHLTHCPSIQNLYKVQAMNNIFELNELAKSQDLGQAARIELLSSFVAKLKFMGQSDLILLLALLKDRHDKWIDPILKRIDKELCKLLGSQSDSWQKDLDLWFYAADLLFDSHFRSTFISSFKDYLTRLDHTKLTDAQVIHLLFYIVLRRFDEGQLLELEKRIIKILDTASFEDVALISMAYFKTRTVIKNLTLLGKIVDKLIENLSKLDATEPGYCSIIKILRYSKTTDKRDKIAELISHLSQSPNKNNILASPFNAVHTVKMTEAYRIYDPKLLDLLRGAMFANLERFRIKDIQYALTSLSNFAYLDLKCDEKLTADFDKLSRSLVEEKRSDIGHQYYHLLPILRAFATFGYYNDELTSYTNRILQDETKFDQMKSVLEFDKSILLVYVSTLIEGGEAKISMNSNIRSIAGSIERYGNLGSVRQDSSLKHLNFVLRSTDAYQHFAISNQFRKIAKALSSAAILQSPEYKFCFQHTLPHINYGDLVITKANQEPGPFDSHNLTPAPIPKGEKHCLIIGIQDPDYIDGHNRLVGYKQFISRLLTKLGYHVIKVHFKSPQIDDIAHQIKSILD